MGCIFAKQSRGTPTSTTLGGLSVVADSRLRGLAVLVLAAALLALSAGCTKTTITEEDVMSKQKQINEATEKALGGPVPPEEQRG